MANIEERLTALEKRLRYHNVVVGILAFLNAGDFRAYHLCQGTLSPTGEPISLLVYRFPDNAIVHPPTRAPCTKYRSLRTLAEDEIRL
jgi:hypothetical protein